MPKASSNPKPAKARDGKAAVVTDEQNLDAITAKLEGERDTIIQHEEAFKAATLPRFCRMGLQCLKAREIFAVANDGSRSQGRNQHTAAAQETSKLSTETTGEGAQETGKLSTETDAEPTSFEDYLAKRVHWLPKASAYKYMAAVKGLRLDHTADEVALDAALELATAGNVKLSLNLLANAGREKPTDDEGPSEDPNTPEARAGEARVAITSWIGTWDQGLRAGNLEDADPADLKKLDEFLTNARDHIRKRLKSAKAEATKSTVGGGEE